MNNAILRSSAITELILHRFTKSSSVYPNIETFTSNDQSYFLQPRLPSSVTMDLAKCLKANGNIQRKKFESIFSRFDRTFSDCEVVDLNELFTESDRRNIPSQRKTTHKPSSRTTKNKRNRRKPSKLVVVSNKKFPKYQTRSVTKRKCSKSTKGTSTRLARKSKTARKSNGRVKDIFPSPLPNGNMVGSVVSRNKSMFCEPPTVMDLDVSDSDGSDNISDVDTNDEGSDKSQFCTPPTIIEVNPSISRSGFCTPPTVINEKLDGNFDLNKEKQSDIWHECFSRYYVPTKSMLNINRRTTKALLKWQKHFAHMFLRSPSL
ncbi:Hypothetical predicted protein [Octopus vulgaris]|uniref:Uncharacterized protein n=1 Tax=Octopus vulgaris TaxID=6645 RepID=A0AA36B4N0_OCTVU|nr:Hypothetical predicted protein [Octopus vulgaris]CAI9727845.1 Hypothetical predicted protein [Octopus vulgaris]